MPASRGFLALRGGARVSRPPAGRPGPRRLQTGAPPRHVVAGVSQVRSPWRVRTRPQFPGGRRLQRPSHQERQRGGVAGRAPAEDLRHVTRGPPRPARGGGLSRPRDPGTRGQGPRASPCSFAPDGPQDVSRPVRGPGIYAIFYEDSVCT